MYEHWKWFSFFLSFASIIFISITYLTHARTHKRPESFSYRKKRQAKERTRINIWLTRVSCLPTVYFYYIIFFFMLGPNRFKMKIKKNIIILSELQYLSVYITIGFDSDSCLAESEYIKWCALPVWQGIFLQSQFSFFHSLCTWHTFIWVFSENFFVFFPENFSPTNICPYTTEMKKSFSTLVDDDSNDDYCFETFMMIIISVTKK